LSEVIVLKNYEAYIKKREKIKHESSARKKINYKEQEIGLRDRDN